MKKLMTAAVLAAGVAVSGFAADFALFKDGKPAAELVIPKQSGKTFQKAVTFFNGELSRCTGSGLPEKSAPSGKLGRITFKLHDRPLAEIDAFSITFPDGKTMQIEGTEHSVRYAFNHLLEKHVGIRWFFMPLKGFYGPEINHYPRKRNISVPAKPFADRPAVNLYRCASWRNQISDNWNRNMLIHGVHMICVDVFPVWKYAADQSWPKEIMPVLDGKKFLPRKPAKLPLPKNPYLATIGYSTFFQFCWSDPATTRIAVENILEILKNNPDKKYINIDVNDMGGYCQCERCTKIVGGKRNSIGKLDYSEIYWKWVNDVAAEVSKTHPDVIFRGIAYTEVLNPPSFRLHKNVLPIICIELVVMLDPEVGPVKQKMWDQWTEKASMLGLYDYVYGEKFYLLPRVYLRSHARLLKNLIKKHKLRYAFFESGGQTVSGGPQQQLFYRLTWNPDFDVDQFLKLYYIDCVGEKAAPYLDRYFTFWENYWAGRDIRKTQWYRSVRNAYMQLGERSTHTYALKKGDLKHARSLIEKVVALADTPDRKLRAKALMQSFEYYELAAKAVFAEIVPPDGKLRNAAQAVELLRAVPDAVKALDQYSRHPLCRFTSDKGSKIVPSCYSAICKVVDFAKDPAVTTELRKLAARKDLPLNLQGQIKIMLGAKPVNLIANGDMEKPGLPMVPYLSKMLPGKKDSAHASSGKFSYKMHKGAFLIHPKIKPGKTYMFLCDVYIRNPEVEGRFNFHLGPSKGRLPLDWIRKLDQIPTAGMWNTYSETVKGNPRGDSVLIQVWVRNFEKENPIWIDNFRLYCLDDMK